MGQLRRDFVDLSEIGFKVNQLLLSCCCSFLSSVRLVKLAMAKKRSSYDAFTNERDNCLPCLHTIHPDVHASQKKRHAISCIRYRVSCTNAEPSTYPNTITISKHHGTIAPQGQYMYHLLVNQNRRESCDSPIEQPETTLPPKI